MNPLACKYRGEEIAPNIRACSKHGRCSFVMQPDDISIVLCQWCEELGVVPSIEERQESFRRAVDIPGSHLTLMLKSWGFKEREGCGCEEWAAKMNAWGWRVTLEHESEIVAHLDEVSGTVRWVDKLRAAPAALLIGVTNTTSLVREACKRAERAESELLKKFEKANHLGKM